ncbi:hypothetical protein WME95_18290 [Sorangium sp. So ce327]
MPTSYSSLRTSKAVLTTTEFVNSSEFGITTRRPSYVLRSVARVWISSTVPS